MYAYSYPRISLRHVTLKSLASISNEYMDDRRYSLACCRSDVFRTRVCVVRCVVLYCIVIVCGDIGSDERFYDKQLNWACR